MIYFGILTHIEGTELKLSKKLIESLKNQLSEYRVILAINNAQLAEVDLPKDIPFSAVIKITGNNIGYARNCQIDCFKKIATEDDRLFLMDGDDYLSTDASIILSRIVMKSDIIPVINFYAKSRDSGFAPYISDIVDNQISKIPAFNWYLWDLTLLKYYSVKYNQGDISHDDLHLYLKLMLRNARFKFITNCVQYYDETFTGNGTLRARAQNVADYLMDDIQYKFDTVSTIRWECDDIKPFEVISTRAPRDIYSYIENHNLEKLNNND